MIMQAKVQAVQVVRKTVPQAHVPDEVADTLVAVQRPVPMLIDKAGRDAKKYRNADDSNRATHHATKLQFVDEFVHIPGGTHRWMPMVEKIRMKIEATRIARRIYCVCCAKHPHVVKTRGQV